MFLLPQLPQLLWRVGGSYGKTFTLAYLSDPFGTRDILRKTYWWGELSEKKFMAIFPFDDFLEKVI